MAMSDSLEAFLGYRGIVAQPCPHTHVCPFRIYLWGAHKHAIRPIFGHGEMLHLGSYQLHVAIDATHKSKVG